MSGAMMFAAVHTALRNASCQVLAQLGTHDRDAIEGVRGLLALHAIHQRVEDRFVIPAIEARRPGAATRLIDAHDDHAAAIDGLLERIDRVVSDPTDAAIHRLYLEVTRFAGDAYLHMYEEEVLAGPLLDEIYTHAELQGLMQQIVGSLTPAEHAAFAPFFERVPR